jgi:hypothetical protein
MKKSADNQTIKVTEGSLGDSPTKKKIKGTKEPKFTQEESDELIDILNIVEDKLRNEKGELMKSLD